MSDNLNRHGSVHNPAKSYVGDIVEKMSATPSDNLNKAVEELLEEYFVMRAARPTDDLAILKLRNEAGSAEQELAQALTTLINNEKIASAQEADQAWADAYNDPDKKYWDGIMFLAGNFYKDRIATLKKGEK